MAEVSAGASDRDRYDRQRRISWIDMDGISSSKVLVVGAGALGNETVKNLVLSGFRDITLIDMDDIVTSNLSRCLFFRDSDVKKGMKADIVADRAKSLSPNVEVKPIVGKVQDLEDWNFDIILGCMDNISARLHVNSHACYHKIPYVDGATDGMNGKLHVVLPGTPCIQCTMNRSHVREMEKRFTCTGNSSTYVPHLASDITTTAVVSGMQVREAMKIASKREDMCVTNVAYYNGETSEMFTLEAHVDKTCPNHEVMEWS